MFKRRDSRSWLRATAELFYPKGGWRRAASYVGHRLRRLPDAPHRIARGIFAGVFVSFTPLFGLHFLAAALIAFVLRGNVFAALLATFFGNPVTFPLIAASSLELGNWLLGNPQMIHLPQVMEAFSSAARQLIDNGQAWFAGEPTNWGSLRRFFARVYLPYLVGGIVPGLIAALVCYYLSLPLIGAYQKLRSKKMRDRADRRLQLRARDLADAEARDWAALQDEAAAVGSANRPDLAAEPAPRRGRGRKPAATPARNRADDAGPTG